MARTSTVPRTRPPCGGASRAIAGGATVELRPARAREWCAVAGVRRGRRRGGGLGVVERDDVLALMRAADAGERVDAGAAGREAVLLGPVAQRPMALGDRSKALELAVERVRGVEVVVDRR